MSVADPRLARELAQALFVAVDPGLDHPAAAVFENGLLQAASRVPVPGKLAQLDHGERERQIAELIANWIRARVGNERVQYLAYERPFVYPHERKKDPNKSLIPLALVAGGVASLIGAHTLAPTPRDWTGGIPKSTTGDAWLSPRGQLVASRIGILERAVIVDSHDAIDAAAIGLFYLNRLGRLYLRPNP